MPDRKPPVFGPEELTVIYAAYDEAWETVKVDHSGDMQTTEVALHRLANAVMLAYRNGVTDLEALKAAGIMMMQRWVSRAFPRRVEACTTVIPALRAHARALAGSGRDLCTWSQGRACRML